MVKAPKCRLCGKPHSLGAACGGGRTRAELIRPAMNEAEARAITAQIKSAAEDLWNLLYEAHERQAWQALGYRTWEEYVSTEFAMHRSRSYQLIDQARVIKAIQSAAGVSTNVDIPEGTTRRIKPHLPAITDAIRERVADGQEPIEAVRATITEYDRLPTPAQAKEIANEYVLSVPATDNYIHSPSAAVTGTKPLRPDIVMPRWNAMKALIAETPTMDEFYDSLVFPTKDQVIADARAAVEWLEMFLDTFERRD